MYGSCNKILIPPPVPYQSTNLYVEEQVCDNVFDPRVWGEGVWLFLHLGSLVANQVLSKEEAEKYWGFIEGLPYMMPCKSCAVHARAYVDASRADRKNICATRDSLLAFFVRFHNSVNARTGKPLITVEQVKNMQKGKARICRTKYF